MAYRSRTRRSGTGAVPAGARFAAVVAASLLTTGCGALNGVVNDPVGERWESRTGLPSCGEVSLEQGEEMGKRAAREIACLRRALGNSEGAELEATYPTTEGDLIREYYRLTPSGRLEVYTDGTDDRHSDGTWSFTECHTPEWLPEISCDR
ncbi:hypothetical protein GCM10010420_04100 [Streptomyces glaucosporus]|uniref:Lipoprotein n=1 Tax=Streptomyces glaucosporus TaxID=284044 RepID=A0ABN3HQG0_9ACTN